MTVRKKDQIRALLKSIETGEAGAVTVVNEDKYIQHNPHNREGSEGLAELFLRLSKTSPRVEIVRAFEDGEFVFAHTEYDFSDEISASRYSDSKTPKTMHFSTAILRAAFVEGRNISLPDVVPEIAQEQDFDPDRFGEKMTSPSIEDNLTTSLRFAAQVRTGFPAVFVQNSERDTLVHLGGADLSVSELQAAVDTEI